MIRKHAVLSAVIVICCPACYHGLGLGTPPQQASAIFPWPVSSATAETAAYVTWNTNVAGTSQVNYGTTSSYSNSTTLNSNLVTYHAQTITGLSPATTYHFQVVSTDTNGNTVNSADQTFTTLAPPTVNVHTVGLGKTYSTISACASAAVSGSSSGWTCEVYAGIYNEVPSISGFTGSSSNQIVFIAHDAALVASWSIAKSSYVTVEGFEITTSFSGSSFESCSSAHDAVDLNTDSYITIANNYMHNVYAGGFVATPFHVTSTYVALLNNVMAFAGLAQPPGSSGFSCSTAGSGSCPCAGSNEGFPGVSGSINYGLFDGNTAQDADHLFVATGSYNIYRRNVWHDTNCADWSANSADDHVDFFNFYQATGYEAIHNLIENNQEYNANVANMHFSLLEGVSTSHDIVERFNLIDNVGSYFMSTGDGDQPNIRIYNDTIVDTGVAIQAADIIFATGSPGGTVLNTLFYNAVTDDGTLWYFDSTSAPGTSPGYNLAYNTDCSSSCSWPSSVTGALGMVLNQNPLFNQSTPYDFTLQASSPALNAGGPLTTVASGDTGTGTSLVVTDAGFFQDGYGISGVNPDCIAVGSATNTVCIASGGVNYSTNTITLANSISRSVGQGVYLYKDSTGRVVLTGSAPNIGATVDPAGASAPTPAPPTNVVAMPH